MRGYEIRPHHCFKGWFLVFRDGKGLRAFANRGEAEEFIQRQKNLDNLKGREVKL